jgi:hypothetical protein
LLDRAHRRRGSEAVAPFAVPGIAAMAEYGLGAAPTASVVASDPSH